MKARRAVVVVSAAQHSRVHRCWHLLIQTLHCGWRVLHCGRRVLHCGRRRSIEIGMLVHKDLHCWSVLRIFTNQGKVSSNIFVNIKIFLRNLRKYLIIYPLDKNPWFGPLCIASEVAPPPSAENFHPIMATAGGGEAGEAGLGSEEILMHILSVWLHTVNSNRTGRVLQFWQKCTVDIYNIWRRCYFIQTLSHPLCWKCLLELKHF